MLTSTGACVAQGDADGLAPLRDTQGVVDGWKEARLHVSEISPAVGTTAQTIVAPKLLWLVAMGAAPVCCFLYGGVLHIVLPCTVK